MQLFFSLALFAVLVSIILFYRIQTRSRNDLSIYHTADWWGERSSFAILRRMNQVRVPYFISKFPRNGRNSGNHPQPVIVDIGCGGGFVVEDLARAGYQHLSGFDISEASLEKARIHSVISGFGYILYSQGSIYSIPLASSSADVVIVSDVLEHLDDIDAALKEVYRVLKPGGVFVFDTIARTVWSWLTTYLMAQEVLGLVDPSVHDWSLFINPDELRARLVGSGFVTNISDYRGINSRWSLSNVIVNRLKYDFIESFFEDNDLSASFMGYATKPIHS